MGGAGLSDGRGVVWRDEPPDAQAPVPLDRARFCAERGIRATWPRGPLAVFASREALEGARRHGHASPGAEVGGILFGRVHAGGGALAVDIAAAVPARGAAGTLHHLAFTPAAWEHVFAARRHLPSDFRVVGWYHTHPGLGVFLSGTDRRTHERFFCEPWQVALVLDPASGAEGAFLAGGERISLGVYPEIARATARSAAPRSLWWAVAVAAAGVGGLLLLKKAVSAPGRCRACAADPPRAEARWSRCPSTAGKDPR